MKKDLVFFDDKQSLFLEKINSKEDIDFSKKVDGYFIISQGNEEKVRKIVDFLKGKNKIIAVEGFDNIFNRRIIETMKVNYLVSIEKMNKKDNIKQRDSGLNHVLGKLAKEKGVGIVVNYSELRNFEEKELSKMLARIIQNLKVARKTGCEIKVASFAKKKKEMVNEKERSEFLISLGASTKQAKESVEFEN